MVTCSTAHSKDSRGKSKYPTRVSMVTMNFKSFKSLIKCSLTYPDSTPIDPISIGVESGYARLYQVLPTIYRVHLHDKCS